MINFAKKHFPHIFLAPKNIPQNKSAQLERIVHANA